MIVTNPDRTAQLAYIIIIVARPWSCTGYSYGREAMCTVYLSRSCQCCPHSPPLECAPLAPPLLPFVAPCLSRTRATDSGHSIPVRCAQQRHPDAPTRVRAASCEPWWRWAQLIRRTLAGLAASMRTCAGSASRVGRSGGWMPRRRESRCTARARVCLSACSGGSGCSAHIQAHASRR